LQATVLESPAGAAGAGIVAAESFFQQLVAVDDAEAFLYLGFGRETSSAFAGAFEKNAISS